MLAKLILPLGLLLTALLTGCGVPSAATDRFLIEADRYPEAFDAARDVLRWHRFEPDRVDARAGVISSDPKYTAGIATPWDLEQSAVEQELSDVANDQRRRVRVTFTPVSPAEPGADPLGAPVPDVRTAQGDIEVLVQVYVERLRSPGWRLNATKINLSSRTSDPALRVRGMEPNYVQTLQRDDALARRLAFDIQKRLR